MLFRSPLWICRSSHNTIEEIKPDKQPIGKNPIQTSFTTHEIKLEKGDVVYLFSDGYADQFGGNDNKKLTKKRFKELLSGISKLPMQLQHEQLLAFHQTYKGSNDQIDDICIIGMRV